MRKAFAAIAANHSNESVERATEKQHNKIIGTMLTMQKTVRTFVHEQRVFETCVGCFISLDVSSDMVLMPV